MSRPIRLLTFTAAFSLFWSIAAAAPQAETSGQSVDRGCMSCHPDRYSEWEASRHATVSGTVAGGKEAASCTTCHTPHFNLPASGETIDPGKTCDSCHDQRAVLQGKGAKGVEETRSMHSAIACVECHMTGNNHGMKVLRPDDPDLPEDKTDSCSTCHLNSSREIRAAQIQDYLKWYKDAASPIQQDLKIVKEALKENPELLNPELKAELADIESNLSIITEDGSEGLHNLFYALEITRAARKDLAALKAAIEGSTPD